MCMPIYGLSIFPSGEIYDPEYLNENNIIKCYGYYECNNYIVDNVNWPHVGSGCGYLPHCTECNAYQVGHKFITNE